MPIDNKTAELLPLYACARRRIDPMMNELDSFVSDEAFANSFVGRFFISIADTLAAIGNTFTSHFRNFGKTLHRSELKEYCESNVFKYKAVLAYLHRASWDVAAQLPVVRPSQMKVKYPDAISGMDAVYKALNVLTLIGDITTCLTDILNEVGTGKGIGDNIRDVATYVNRARAAIVNPVRVHQGHFNGSKHSGDVTYGECFGVPEGLEISLKQLKTIEFRLNDIAELSRRISDMESILSDVVKAVTSTGDDGVKVSTAELKTLGKAITDLSILFDVYSMVGTRHLATEHNVVITFNMIYDNMR